MRTVQAISFSFFFFFLLREFTVPQYKSKEIANLVSSNNKADVPLSFNPSAFLIKVVNLTKNLLHTFIRQEQSR